MLYNTKYNNLYYSLINIFLSKIHISILYLYFLKKNNFFFFLKYSMYTNNNFLETNKIYLLYLSLFKVNNLFISNIFLFFFIKKKISAVFFPKRYKLYTLLRSPHIDKRSREQFHIIESKTALYAPIILNLCNFSILNIVFNFKKGSNIILLKKKII